MFHPGRDNTAPTTGTLFKNIKTVGKKALNSATNPYPSTINPKTATRTTPTPIQRESKTPRADPRPHEKLHRLLRSDRERHPGQKHQIPHRQQSPIEEKHHPERREPAPEARQPDTDLYRDERAAPTDAFVSRFIHPFARARSFVRSFVRRFSTRLDARLNERESSSRLFLSSIARACVVSRPSVGRSRRTTRARAPMRSVCSFTPGPSGTDACIDADDADGWRVASLEGSREMAVG